MTGAIWISENSIHRKSVREFVHIPGPLRIGLPLHIGFSRMSSGTDWVSENSVHRKLGFREDPFSAIECIKSRRLLLALLGDSEAPSAFEEPKLVELYSRSA